MSDEKEVVTTAFTWADRTLWSIMALFALGALGRILVSSEPFDLRRFAGELILSVIAAVILFSFNVMQGMTTVQIVFFGALGSLGGVRMIEWVIKIARKMKSNGVL